MLVETMGPADVVMQADEIDKIILDNSKTMVDSEEEESEEEIEMDEEEDDEDLEDMEESDEESEVEDTDNITL